MKRAVDIDKPYVKTITTSGDVVTITFSENVTVTGTATLNYSLNGPTASATGTGTATAAGDKVTITLIPGHSFASGVTVNSITGLTVKDTALTPNTATLTGLGITVTATPSN